MYVEYTGTGLTSILNKHVINDEKEVYHICKKEFEKKWDLIWLKSLGFNNTYTITMRKQHADRLGVSAISDLERYQDELSAGFDHEFLARPDGYPGLIGHYGFKFKKPPRAMDTGLMYKAIADKQVDVICGFATDGRIPAFDLVILVDDKRFFPPYFAAPLVRGDILARFPGMRAVLNELAGKISNAEMARMNYLVDKGGERPAKVGEDFLRRKGLI